jgi:hypothetical protein
MDELIGRLAAGTGVDRAAAEKAVGIILDFLQKEAPPALVQPAPDKLPKSEPLAKAANKEGGRGGLMGGATGGPMGGVMGAGMRMMSAGLSMGQVQDLTRQFIALAREKVGENEFGAIVPAIPGRGQFV